MAEGDSIMPAGVRQGDLCSGHDCHIPRPPTSWSHNVRFNNKFVVRVSDDWDLHCCPPCHTGTQATGSPNIRINGKFLARIGDSIDCGSKNAQGSPNVFGNGR